MVRSRPVLALRAHDARTQTRALPVEHGHRRRGGRGSRGGALGGHHRFLHPTRHHRRRRRHQGVQPQGAASRAGTVRRPGGVLRARLRRRGQDREAPAREDRRGPRGTERRSSRDRRHPGRHGDAFHRPTRTAARRRLTRRRRPQAPVLPRGGVRVPRLARLRRVRRSRAFVLHRRGI